jgi:excisionase family DNA binding protein
VTPRAAWTGTNNMDDEQLLRSSEVAKLFGVTKRTVATWARQGAFDVRRTSGGQYRFPRSVVERELASTMQMRGHDDTG